MLKAIHKNRSQLEECESITLFSRICRHARISDKISIRVYDKKKNRYRRSDSLIKYRTAIFRNIKKLLSENDGVNIAQFFDILNDNLSTKIDKSSARFEFFDTINDSAYNGNTLISSLQKAQTPANNYSLSDEELADLIDIQEVLEYNLDQLLDGLEDAKYSMKAIACVMVAIKESKKNPNQSFNDIYQIAMKVLKR